MTTANHTNDLLDHYHRSVERLNDTVHWENIRWANPTYPRDFFFERAQRVMEFFDHPERGFHYIHVAGTSGKGSTTQMIYEVLVRAGYRVGAYFSPYVTTPIENIQINGQLVDPALFMDVLDEVLARGQQAPVDSKWRPSYYTIFFVVALECFRRSGCEWVVLETGCGGRYDLTNVVPNKIAAVITPIGYDHVDVLGTTLREIAWHKAGIITPGCRVYTTPQSPEVLTVLSDETQRAGTDPIAVASPSTPQPSTMAYTTVLPGDHQQTNASLAAAVCRSLHIDDTHIRAGIAAARLPARVEVVQEHPRVILDGAHSGPKIAALLDTLVSYRPWKRLHLIFAAKKTKSIDELILPLLAVADTVTLTEFSLPGFSSHPASSVAAVIRRSAPHCSVSIVHDAVHAADAVLQRADPDDLVLITGSLYYLNTIRERWYPEEKILQQRSLFPTP